MNKHILLVMKWLNDKDSVSQKELEANRDAADATDAADAAYADAVAAYAAAAAADDAADAGQASAADAVAYAAYAAYDAEKWVGKYFERTGENKQDYIHTATIHKE